MTISLDHLISAEDTRSFDLAVALLQVALDVPVALLSVVVGPRQILLAERGLALSPGAQDDSPVSWPLCDRVRRTDFPVMLDDVLADPLTPMPRTPQQLTIGAYLGVPVHVPGSGPVGALCAIDHAPRGWRSRDLDTAVMLARIAERDMRRPAG